MRRRWRRRCWFRRIGWSGAKTRCWRHRVAEEGEAFGRGRAAIRFGAGQECQLPDAGIADAGAWGGACDGGPASVSARELDERSSAAGARRGSDRVSSATPQARDRPGGDRSRDGGRRAFRLRPYGCRLRAQRAIPSRTHGARSGLGGRHPASPQGVPRRRRRHIPDVLSTPAQDMLANARWRAVSWRAGTKGRLKARFAALRVRIADGPPQRIWDKGQQHLPGDEAWLIGEHRMSGEKKYYLANLSAKTGLRALAATIKARWICEQAHQQLKEELGLDHFEGRSWQGLHRHALMTMIAYAFLQHRRLKTARREKKNQRATAATDLARRAPSHPRTHRSTTAAAMPALPKMDLQRAAACVDLPK